MDNQNNKDYIDAEYKDANENDNINKSNTKDTIINGEPLFYTTTQVSQMVGVETSTIRFWGKRFERLLNVEFSNKSKQYKKSDVEKLKFIKKLAKEDGLTLQQIEDYCSAKGFNINDIEHSILDTNNPLAIQTFISATTVEIDKKLNKFSEELLVAIDNKLKSYSVLQDEINERNRELLITTVDEIVSERVNTELNLFKKHLDEKQESTLQLQKENFDYFTNQFNGLVEEQKELQQKQQDDFNEAVKEFLRTTTRMEKREKIKGKSFWNKLFKKD